ncbi:DEAD/DEAH box helicase family protein [Paulownia witches'-broom phytoplasma]|uniref:DEAD/DEAH box helicase family protein n=1 Tax=Paulownia witches'-broom phytoplasma TaxID=39647 RepID=A0ABX8TRU2_9MOLU|nr:DEAD/DEAH box helicase family protein [Paulownia witches'-broom phytoplasma]
MNSQKKEITQENPLNVTNNIKKNSHIWHTRGSGKTLTAFLLCRYLKKFISINETQKNIIVFL